VLVAIACARPVTEGDVPLRYAVLGAQAWSFVHLAWVSLARARPARSTAERARRVSLSVVALAALLFAIPAHFSKAREVGAWVDRVDRETGWAIQSGWTPAELALHFGDDLYPYDRDALERVIARLLPRRSTPEPVALLEARRR
jgi:hypothetical protein